MKKHIPNLSLIILPVMLFAVGYVLKETHGPYYLWWFDQSYAYLVNSLNITQLKEVGGVAHPGTPLQILGALIIVFKYFISGSTWNLPHDVFTNSETYLLVIQTVLISLNSIVLLIVGIITLRLTQNLFQSIILQLSPFTAFFIYYGLLIVSSEQILILASLCLICLSIFYIYNNKIEKDSRWKLILISSLICGIGIASKLNFFPLIFIPLVIIRGSKYKMYFCLIVILFFLILLIPLMSQYGGLFVWIKDLFFSNAQKANVYPIPPNLLSFINNIFKIFSEDCYFAFAYLMCLTTLTYSLFRNIDLDDFIAIKSKTLLIGIFISFNVQIILVAKYYTQYFMIPSFMMSNLSIVVCLIILTSIFHLKNNRIGNLIYVIIILGNLSYGIYLFDKWYQILEWNRLESIKTENYIETIQSNSIVISFTGSADLGCVLEYSTHCSGEQIQNYKYILNNIVSNKIYYDPNNKQINSLCDKVVTDSILCNYNKLILRVRGDGLIENFLKELGKIENIRIIESKELFRNGSHEFVYQISYKCESLN